MAVIVFFGYRRSKSGTGRSLFDGCQRIGFACQDYLDTPFGEPRHEPRAATSRDENIEAVEGMRFAGGVLVDAHFHRQIELADLKNVTIGSFKDHEPARFSCVSGNGVEILARDANLHAWTLFGSVLSGCSLKEDY